APRGSGAWARAAPRYTSAEAPRRARASAPGRSRAPRKSAGSAATGAPARPASEIATARTGSRPRARPSRRRRCADGGAGSRERRSWRSPQNEEADERRDGQLRLNGESCACEGARPCAPRVKMKEARTEREEVGAVAQVLGDDDASVRTEDASELAEQRRARAIGPQLVRREEQQRGIDVAGRHRQ